jgi:hypothetical protein
MYYDYKRTKKNKSTMRARQQSHVHLEYRDLGFTNPSNSLANFNGGHPEKILEMFTRMKPEDLLSLGPPLQLTISLRKND